MTTQPVIDDFENLTDTIGVFLGFRPTAADLAAFPFDIYSFIIRRVREIDEKFGNSLIKRFLEGPQEVWVRMGKRAEDLLTLFDPEVVEARFLPSLLKLVGFGGDAFDIIRISSEDEIRTIIAGAIPFWRARATREAGPKTAVNLVTGNRFKVRSYFDFRFIVGETEIIESLTNLEPNMLDIETINRFRRGDDGVSQFGANTKRFSAASGAFVDSDVEAFIVIQDIDAPGSNGSFEIVSVISATEVEVSEDFPSALTGLTWFTGFIHDEFITEIRLVDDITGDGAINRPLLRFLVELQRATSERFNIVYVTFMDLFTTLGDQGQFKVSGTDDFTHEVEEGVLNLFGDVGASGSLVTDYFNDDTWKNYSLKAKVSQTLAGVWQIIFLRTDEDDNYYLEVEFTTPTNGTVKLFKTVSGTPTQLSATFAFTDLSLDVFWVYTIDVFRNEISGLTNIEVRLDNNTIITESDADFEIGNIGFRVAPSCQIKVAEVELWEYPLAIDRVGPNP